MNNNLENESKNVRQEAINKNNTIKMKTMKTLLIIFLIIFVVLFVMIKNYVGEEIMVLLYGTFFAVSFLSFCVLRSEQKHNRTNLKTAFTDNLMQKLYTNVELDNTKGFSKDIINASGLTCFIEMFKSYGYVSSQYKDIRFEQAFVEISYHPFEQSDIGNNTAFSGKWIIFDFNKQFKTNIRLIDRTSTYATIDTNVSPFLRLLDSSEVTAERKQIEKYNKVDFEDAYLKKSFKTYVKEMNSAKMMLEPVGYESLKSLRASIKGRLFIGFLDNKLHIAIDENKNAFKDHFFGKINPETADEQAQTEMESINKFIDEINANPNMFK